MPAVVDSLTLLIRLGYTFTDDIGTTGAGPIHLHRNRWIFPLDTASLITLYVLAGLVIGQGVLVVWFTCALWRWKRPLLADAAAVWLAARNALGGNRDTIEIVHLLGGSDAQIARIFQRSILADAVIGGALGLVIGMAAVWLMGAQFAALDSGLVSSGGLQGSDWLVLALVPVGAVALAVLTAR